MKTKNKLGLNWVFYKLREWVETVTGKGDRWEADRQVGRSEPAFLAASTTALPPPTCTAWREAGQHYRQLLFRCEAGQLLAVCFEACAGRRVRRLCLPAVPCSAGCVPARLCHAMPTALLNSLPPFIFLCLPPVHSMCARIEPTSLLHHVCKLQDCPVGSCNTGLQWRPVRRFLCDFSFFLQCPLILGHG